MRFSLLWLIDPFFFFRDMLKSKPIAEEPPDPLNVPTTTIGTNIGVLWGTRLLKQPIMVWYGNVRIIKVKVDAQAKK